MRYRKTHSGKSHRNSKRVGRPQRGGVRQWDKERKGEREKQGCLREVRRDKHRAQAVATRPVRASRVGSRFQMGHIWEPVVTLWLPRDQRELWPGGVGLGKWRPGQRAFHRAGRVQPSRLPSREVRVLWSKPCRGREGGCDLRWNVGD